MSFDKMKTVNNTNTEATPVEVEKTVTRTTRPDQKQATQREFVGYVKGVQNLNVRANPMPDADILTTLPMGTAVTVKGSAGDYYRIVTPGLIEGFVIKGFLDVRR